MQWKQGAQSKFKARIAAKVSFKNLLGKMKVNDKPIMDSLGSLASGNFNIEATVALMVSDACSQSGGMCCVLGGTNIHLSMCF